ncbi:MAG TPA: L-threonylcarbamoyladenylate synthase [Pyrinomonadaceae bacterium]|jgi:L-threonylcarbamoyladenylate synthase
MIVSDSQSARLRAAAIISAGGIVAFRTDTFYGLGADPFNKEALASLKELKGREAGKPILVIISDPKQAERFIAERSELFEQVCQRHWPGPLTIVVRARSAVPVELTAGTETIGVRLPDDEGVREFVRACGGALTATSANVAGEPPARTAQEVADSFPAGLGLIIDGGSAQSDQPSTVLDLSGREPRLIREGALSKPVLDETFASLGKQLSSPAE